jgi:hypothetical protein
MVAGSAPPFVPMLAAMYTIQLLCFTVQETAEALAGGGRATPLVDLLLLGALGQLPVALVTALAVRWLLARVRPAIATLRVTPVSTSIPTVFAITSWPLATESVVRVEVFDRSDVRGPPSF